MSTRDEDLMRDQIATLTSQLAEARALASIHEQGAAELARERDAARAQLAEARREVAVVRVRSMFEVERLRGHLLAAADGYEQSAAAFDELSVPAHLLKSYRESMKRVADRFREVLHPSAPAESTGEKS